MMHKSFTVTREHPNRLGKAEYRYWLNDDLKLVIDFIGVFERPTTRHKYELKKQWNRRDGRGNTLTFYEPMFDIQQEVLRMARQSIEIQEITTA